METAEEIEEALAQFCGTTEYHGPTFPPVLQYTDGVKYLADSCKAHWLLDALASHYPTAVRRCGDFQLWKLSVAEDRSAVLECAADTGREPCIRQRIEFTDFPLKKVVLWVEGNVILLPSEH